MASNCIDRNDQTTVNSLNRIAGSATNANGEYTLNQIDIFAKEFADNLVKESQANPIVVAQIKYGDSFYNSLAYLNSLLKDKDLEDFPSLSERLDSGDVSSLEFADFITLFNLTPNGVTSSGSRDLLYQLNRYYANDIKFGSLGGVCRLFETVFAKVDGFFNFIGQVGALIASAVSFLSKARDLKNFVLESLNIAVITGLINQIKELITNEINNMIDAMRLMFENFNLEEIIGDIRTRLDKATIRRIMRTKDQACLITSDESKKSIVDKMLALFDYAVGIMDNPGIAEIQFLITRFCAFISNVKALLLDFKVPMDQFEFKYKRIANRLKTISNITSSTAIRNGAIRFSTEARAEQINSIQQSWEGSNGVYYTPTGEEPINPIEPTISEYSNLPSCNQVKDGSDPRIAVSGDWVTDFGMEGWTGLDYDLRVYLLRLQSMLGVKITITNGWVSQQYNARVGGDPDSSHMSGKSVDISRPTNTVDDIEFSRLVFKSGFKFVKFYDRHIHLDTRPLIG